MKLHTESESLLTEPGSNLPDGKFDRTPSTDVVVHDEFDARKHRRQFSRQYAHSYSVRLWAVRSKLEDQVKAEWPGVDIKKIAELCEFSKAQTEADMVVSEEDEETLDQNSSRKSGDHGQNIQFREGVTVAVIGTIFKYQPEKPSILQELAEDNPMVPIIPKSKYISEKDTIQLEDETTRVHLMPTEECGMKIGTVVNGIVCAVKGRPNSNGKFEVVDVLYPTARPKSGLDLKMDYEMVFVSGLEFGNNKNEAQLQIDVLLDYLEGLAGCPSELNETKERTKVFFVGNTFLSYVTPDGKEKKIRTDIAQNLDEALDQLSQTMDVFIIPGENDPTESMLPQIPLHRCVFPRSSRRSTFRSLTNPARVEIPISKGKQHPKLDILLSSGQNINDALRNSELTSPLEMALHLLRWGHICPTAPDTLPLHPGVDEDVFVLKNLPDIFVVGNQPTFEAIEWKNTKVFTVPKFSNTGTVVLMNSEMNFLPISFKLM